MRFEKEINIYSDEAIIKRFKANETSVNVVQGKISALISESELVELQNSKATMYSKLASAVMEVSGLKVNFSDLTTKYNTVTDQYEALDSRVTEYALNVNGLSLSVLGVQQDVVDLKTWQNSTDLKISDSAIVATVTASEAWNGKADKDKLITQINLTSDSATIKSSKIKLEGLVTANNNFQILLDGSIVAKNGTFTGNITGSKITGSTLSVTSADGCTLSIDATGLTLDAKKTSDIFGHQGGVLSIGTTQSIIEDMFSPITFYPADGGVFTIPLAKNVSKLEFIWGALGQEHYLEFVTLWGKFRVKAISMK